LLAVGPKAASPPELDRIAATMLARYRALSLEAISDAIFPIDILFA